MIAIVECRIADSLLSVPSRLGARRQARLSVHSG
jgi:hypothetical protein